MNRRLLSFALGALLVCVAACGVRSLQLDHRGNSIYAQRQRESGTIKGFFTDDWKGFQARETSLRGLHWGSFGIALAGTTGIGTLLLGTALRRLTPMLFVLAALHIAFGSLLLTYWLVTGIPKPWQD